MALRSWAWQRLALGILMPAMPALMFAACGRGSDPAPTSQFQDETPSPTKTMMPSVTAASDEATGPSATASATNPRSSDPSPAPVGSVSLIPIETSQDGVTTVGVNLTGRPFPVAAFNFDIVYDQSSVTVSAPAANTDALTIAERTFQCDLPPASSDVDPDPRVGRARLVCFSFGGPEASSPGIPLTLATVDATGLERAGASLRLDNVAVYAPDGSRISVIEIALIGPIQ